MGRLLIAGFLGVFSVLAASAQERPDTIEPDAVIELGVGQAKTLQFHEQVDTAGTVTKDIAEITVQSDRVLTIAGQAPGRTMLIVYGQNGKALYRANVLVTPGEGHLVKMYGQTKDYVGVYCNQYTCGRPDLDKKLANGGRDPDAPTSTMVTTPLVGGGTVTRTYENR